MGTGMGGNGNRGDGKKWEWECGVGMGMIRWEWEWNGNKKSFPHTSTANAGVPNDARLHGRCWRTVNTGSVYQATRQTDRQTDRVHRVMRLPLGGLHHNWLLRIAQFYRRRKSMTFLFKLTNWFRVAVKLCNRCLFYSRHIHNRQLTTKLISIASSDPHNYLFD